MFEPARKTADAVEWHQKISDCFLGRYERSQAFRERLSVWTEFIDESLGENAHVLDAGCGPGVFSCIAARRCKWVSALDGSASMLELARRRAANLGVANIDFHAGLIGDGAVFAGRRFDGILCSSVLEYAPDLDAALDWLTERLAPGGALLVSMPNAHGLYRRLERIAFRLTGRPRYYAYVRRLASAAEFAQALKRRGLKTQAVRFYAGPAALRSLLPGRRWSEKVENLFVIAARRSP